jgi:hypothetical protein
MRSIIATTRKVIRQGNSLATTLPVSFIRAHCIKVGLARAVKNGSKLGRPSSSKDKVLRKRDGYFNRYANKPSVNTGAGPSGEKERE